MKVHVSKLVVGGIIQKVKSKDLNSLVIFDSNQQSSERAKAELQAALTSSGRLASVSLTNCEWVSMALVNSILTHNGHLHTLKLNNTHIAYEGNRKVKKSPQKGPDVNTKGLLIHVSMYKKSNTAVSTLNLTVLNKLKMFKYYIKLLIMWTIQCTCSF